MRSAHRQRGSVVAWLVILLAVTAIAVTAGEAELLANKQHNDRPYIEEAYLRQTGAAVTAWYQRNLASIDAAGAADPNVNDVLTGAGILPRYGLHIAVSQRQSAGNLNWHVVALWINDSETDTTTFNASTGVLNPDSKARSLVVSGQLLQQAAWQATTAAVNSVVVALNSFAQHRQAANGGDLTRNPFRAADCNNVAPGELPCLDNYVSAATVSPQLGMNASQLVDAWNGVLQVSNGADSKTTMPPYSMAIKAVSPWGASVTGTALQTIN